MRVWRPDVGNITGYFYLADKNRRRSLTPHGLFRSRIPPSIVSKVRAHPACTYLSINSYFPRFLRPLSVPDGARKFK
jgi:hypothetical protein